MPNNIIKKVTKWVEPETEPTQSEVIAAEVAELKIKVILDEATAEEIEKLKLLTL